MKFLAQFPYFAFTKCLPREVNKIPSLILQHNLLKVSGKKKIFILTALFLVVNFGTLQLFIDKNRICYDNENDSSESYLLREYETDIDTKKNIRCFCR